jgi:hypothetical protein
LEVEVSVISRVAGFTVLGLTFCGQLAVRNATAAPMPEPPLRIKQHWLVPVEGDATNVMAVLQNESTKVAVAWTIKTVLTFADGTSTIRHLETEVAPDGMTSSINGPILPGQERAVQSVYKFKSLAGVPTGATVSVIAAVFADETAAGEADALHSIAKHRRQMNSDWQQALAILENASKDATGSIDTLTTALGELDRTADSSPVLRHVRLRIQMTLQRVQQSGVTGDAELAQLVDYCRRQRTEASARLLARIREQ